MFVCLPKDNVFARDFRKDVDESRLVTYYITRMRGMRVPAYSVWALGLC